MKRREKLLELVKKEAKFLRTMLTSTEKAKLSFEYLDSSNTTECIYGQATGNCNNQRSLELILDGCERIYKTDGKTELKDLPLNGKPTWVETGTQLDTPSRITQYYSPIEVFIAEDDDENNKNLLNYIKGTKKTLQIK